MASVLPGTLFALDGVVSIPRIEHMFESTPQPDVRSGADGVGTSTAGVPASGVGQTAPALDPVGLLRDTASATADPVGLLRNTASAARTLADLDWEGLAAADVDRALKVHRQLDGAVAALRTRLVAAAAAGVVDAAGAADITSVVRDRLGMSAREARRQAALADGLAGLDDTRTALADGDISADAARLVADAVTDGRLGSAEQAEPVLLEQASRLDPDRLGRWIRRRQAAAAPADLEAQEARAIRNRNIWKHERPDGTVDWNLRLPHYTSAMFETALAAYATVDPADTPEEARRTFGQRQADAFGDLLGEALSAPAAGRPGRVRPHVLVVGSVATFRDGEGTADLDGRPISAELARRIACDAGMSRLLVDAASLPLDLGREVRNWSAGQRRAIVARDGHCRGPSCDRPAAWCDIHHIDWWSHDGRTDLDNGVLLCGRHHDLVHHGGWTIDLDASTGQVTWTSPLRAVEVTEPAGVLTTLADAEQDSSPARGPTVPTTAAEQRGPYTVRSSAPSRDPDPRPARRRRRGTSTHAPGRQLVAITGRHGRAP